MSRPVRGCDTVPAGLDTVVVMSLDGVSKVGHYGMVEEVIDMVLQEAGA